jgi:hypothetical protein
MPGDDVCVEDYRLVGALEQYARALPDVAFLLWQAPKRADQSSSWAYRYPIVGTGFLFQLKSGRTAPRLPNKRAAEKIYFIHKPSDEFI